ncbi:MAG: HrcA family transcriptional regulator, partial [Christensenellaceae bacterium]
VLDGAVNIFHYPEYKDIDKARHFLTMLETRDQLYRMLAKRTKWEYTITIGDENQERELRDYSVVTATYKVGSRPVGSIGVIGPMRMNYPRVVQVLSEATQSLGEICSEKNHNLEHRNGKGEQNEKA